MLERGWILGAIAAAGLMACGGSQKPQAASSPTSSGTVSVQPTAKVARSHTEVVLRKPTEINVRVKRVGSALNVQVNALGRGRVEGEPFEDPTNWTVVAESRGAELQRVVNGPVRLGRSPVGKASGNKWDVDLRFSMNYVLPAHGGPVTVKVTDPEGTTKSKTVRP